VEAKTKCKREKTIKKVYKKRYTIRS